jgi:hypothetical protein
LENYRGVFIQRPVLRDVVVAVVGCGSNVCVKPEDGYNMSRNMSLM